MLQGLLLIQINGPLSKVGRSKPPLVLTSGFNRPGQYAKKWSILVNMNLSGRLKILRDVFVVN